VTEQDVRDGLRGAVAGEPPLDLDPDALIATARRELRRRRALVSVGVATSAIAVAAVAVPVVLGVPHSTAPVATHPPAPTTSTPRPSLPSEYSWPPARDHAKHYTATELTRRGQKMRLRLAKDFAMVVRDATALDIQDFQGEAAGDVHDGQGYLDSFLTYRLGGHRLAVGVNVYAPGAFTDSPATLCARDPSRCALLGKRGHGEVLAVGESAGSGREIVSVYHFRQDGSVTYVSGYNYDPTGTQRPNGGKPLTVEQLASIATDPALGL
jgi:hypothetical protein